MPGEAILIVEDDPALQRGLQDHFQRKGYDVRSASDGEQGLAAAFNQPPDLILLDLMLPKVNGYEICRRLREEGSDVPIILLTAKGEEQDIVLGLNLGADDYVTKPFSAAELSARVRAILRRRKPQSAERLSFGPFEINLAARTLERNGAPIELTPKEFDFLALLASRPGKAFTREEILKRVWGYSIFVTHRSVDRCVTTLRAKIESNPKQPTLIITIRETGYRFDAPEEEDRQ